MTMKMTLMMIMMMIMMMMMLSSLHQQVEGFNLWKANSATLKGPPGSMFGYSVALWSDEDASKRLVVGAPKGKDHPHLDVGNYPLGNLFLCDLTGQCTVDQRLPTVSEKDGSQAALTEGFSMRRHGMGFGETLTSLKQERSPLAVCAPRYPRSKPLAMESRGACFILKDKSANPKVIVPYMRKTPKYKTVENALMGFSAALINDTSPPTIAIGGPLAYSGKGVVVIKPTESDDVGFVSRTHAKPTTATSVYEAWSVARGKFDGQRTSIVVSSVNFRNRGMVKFYSKELTPEEEVNPNNAQGEIYGSDVGAKFGYSLGVGDFDGDTVDDLLVGCPWATPVTDTIHRPDVGKVFVYYAPLLKIPRGQELFGSHDWGNFGFSAIGLGDINRDGYDDAAVGAPYADSRESSGIVYIYNGSPDGLITEATQVIRASDFPTAMRGFGFSLDGGIDMDNNGYPDVLIGAEESDESLFVRSAPVMTLVGSVSFETDALKVENKSCDLAHAGYKKEKGVCFYLNVELRYTSLNMTSDMNVVLEMVLQDETEPPQFVFKVTNDRRYTRPVSIRSIEKKPIKTGEVIFAKNQRSVIGKPVKVSVSVHLAASASLADNASSTGGDTDDLTPVPPVLDALSPTTFNTSVILTCDNNKTCFSKPDMAIKADMPTLVIGVSPTSIPVLLHVRNDPAYEVEVTVTHPPSLKYQRVEGDTIIPECIYTRLVGIPSYTKFTCHFTFIEEDEKVNFTLFFEHQPLDLMNYLDENSQDHVTINFKVHSDSTDTDERDNRFSGQMPVKTKAVLYMEGESLPETMAVKVNETISLNEIEKVFPPNNLLFAVHRLGPRINQKFSITNQGPSPVKGAKLNLQLALYRGDNRAIYLLEEPSTSEGITCQWPTINPWKLQVSQEESRLLNSTNTTQGMKSRRRRQIEKDQGRVLQDSTEEPAASGHSELGNPHENHDGSSDVQENTVPSSNYHPTRNARSSTKPPSGVKYFDCNLPKCQVICEVDLLHVEDQVWVNIPGYLVIATLDQFDQRKIGVRSWVTATISQKGSVVINPMSPATTFVTLLKPPGSGLSAVPFWILILAVLGSILLILVIMFILYMMGFFKRKRPPTDPNRKSLLHSDFPPAERSQQEIAAIQD